MRIRIRTYSLLAKLIDVITDMCASRVEGYVHFYRISDNVGMT